MEKYTYTIACQSNGQSEATSEKQNVEDADSRIAALLEWIVQRLVFNANNEVICHEEIVYFVKDGPHMAQEPAKWQATVTVFSVWDQQQQVITFNLRDEQ